MPATDSRAPCVIFDFGGVISRPQRPEFSRELAAMLGAEPAAVREAYRADRAEYDRGSLDGPAYWRRVLARVGCTNPRVGMDELIAFDTESWTSIDSRVLDAAEALKKRGLRLGVLSNMPWELGRTIRRRYEWLGRLFEAVTFSCEIGAIKPEPAIYADVLGRLGAPAGDCLFLDDTEANVLAARDLGMNAILFRPTDDVDRVLDDALGRAP